MPTLSLQIGNSLMFEASLNKSSEYQMYLMMMATKLKDNYLTQRIVFEEIEELIEQELTYAVLLAESDLILTHHEEHTKDTLREATIMRRKVFALIDSHLLKVLNWIEEVESRTN